MAPNALRVIADITPYQFFMLALSLWALCMLGADTILRLDEPTSVMGRNRPRES